MGGRELLFCTPCEAWSIAEGGEQASTAFVPSQGQAGLAEVSELGEGAALKARNAYGTVLRGTLVGTAFGATSAAALPTRTSIFTTFLSR